MIVHPNGQQLPVTLGTGAVLQHGRVHPSQINLKMESGLSQLDGSSHFSDIAGPSKSSKQNVFLKTRSGTSTFVIFFIK